MLAFPEYRAHYILKATGYGQALTPRRFAWDCVEWAGAQVVTRVSGTLRKSKQEWRDDGGSLISLALTADERKEAEDLIEELGHHFTGTGPVGLFRPHDWREERRANNYEARYEAECQHFQDAIWLPYRVMQRVQNEADAKELIWEAGIDEETFRRRRTQIEFLELDFSDPPSWSAWGHYEVERVPSNLCPRLRVFSVGWDGPTLEIPFQGEADFERKRWQVHADLAALRPHEFALKYSIERLGVGQNVRLHWQEFLGGPGASLKTPRR